MDKISLPADFPASRSRKTRLGFPFLTIAVLFLALVAYQLLISRQAAQEMAKNDANNLTLVQNIERLKLAVDRILPLHGRIVPLAELYAAVGATVPK